jgi:drug/metabolite transporter (DMT)-like permease
VPDPVALCGIAATIVGAYLVTNPGDGQRIPARDSLFAFATAGAWALSAVLILEGLKGFNSPLLGVTLGIFAAAAAAGAILMLMPAAHRSPARNLDVDGWKLFAGLVVGLATWGRWVALEDAAVAVVLALNLLSVPVVLILSPLLARRHVEVVTARIWGGATLVILGALLMIGGG